MSSSATLPRCLGTRRLGGPILLKDVLPALLDELHEVYVARGGLAPRDPERAWDEQRDASAAFSTAA
jgi:hypothetical protein